MPKFVLNPEEEMLRGLKPAQVRAIRRLWEGLTDLDAGQLCRVAEGMRQGAKLIDAHALTKVRLRKGQQRIISGTTFTHEPAHEVERLKGEVVREKYPKAKHPQLYGFTNHKEKVDIKVGPLEA